MDIQSLLVLFFGATFVLALLLLFALFVPKFHLARTKAPSEQVLKYLAFCLRTRRYLVEEKPGCLLVRAGPSHAVKLYARGTPQQTDIHYRATATPSGWGTMLFLLLTGFVGIVAAIAVIWYFTRARRFARREIVSLIPADGIPVPAKPDDIRAMMINGLSEEHRYVSEATRATETLYTDGLIVLILFGLFIWFISVGYFYESLSSYEIFARIVISALFGVLAAIPFFAIAAYLTFRRFAPQLRRFEFWLRRLSEALDFEILHTGPLGEKESTFEVLLEGSKQVPAWIEAKRKSGFSRNPVISYLLFSLGMASFYLLFFAVMGISFFGLEGYILGAVGGIFGLVFTALSIWWHFRGRKEAARAMAQWDSRHGELRARMERFLQEL